MAHTLQPSMWENHVARRDFPLPACMVWVNIGRDLLLRRQLGVTALCELGMERGPRHQEGKVRPWAQTFASMSQEDDFAQLAGAGILAQRVKSLDWAGI